MFPGGQRRGVCSHAAFLYIILSKPCMQLHPNNLSLANMTEPDHMEWGYKCMMGLLLPISETDLRTFAMYYKKSEGVQEGSALV